MRTVRLGEVIAPAPNRRVGNHANLPILSMTMHNGLVDQEAKFRKRVASADISGYKAVRRNQLVVGFPIDEGVLDFQDLYPLAAVSPAYGVWDIASPARVDSAYLSRYLTSPRALAYYRSKLQGSTARRRSLPAEIFLDLPVYLPELSEQSRIAAILDEADTLRAKHQASHKQLLSIQRAVFHDYFQSRFDEHAIHEPLRNLIHLKSGSFLPSSAQDGGRFPVYGANGVIGQHSRYMYEQPVTVVGRVGACGSVHRTSTRAWVTDNALVVTEADERLLPQYLKFALEFANLAQYANRSSQPVISAKAIGEVRILVPRQADQQEFVKIASATAAQAALSQSRLARAEELFASLQSRAFRGEL